MRLIKSFFPALLVAVIGGLFIFKGVPILGYLLYSGRWLSPVDESVHSLATELYVMYLMLLGCLSAANMIQAQYFKRKGKLTNNLAALRPFFITGIALYLVVFSIQVFNFRGVQWAPVILFFSIPFVICCSAWIYSFRFFIEWQFKIPHHEII